MADVDDWLARSGEVLDDHATMARVARAEALLDRALGPDAGDDPDWTPHPGFGMQYAVQISAYGTTTPVDATWATDQIRAIYSEILANHDVRPAPIPPTLAEITATQRRMREASARATREMAEARWQALARDIARRISERPRPWTITES